MATPPRYRKLEFGADSVQSWAGENGITYVKSTQPLRDYPLRITDRLNHWAQTVPERTFIAKRDAAGEWRRISYAQALESARRIGQALLNRGLSAASTSQMWLCSSVKSVWSIARPIHQLSVKPLK